MFAYDDCFSEPWEKPTEAVVLQHGMLRNGEFWRHWVPYFARKYRVLRPDFPGNGRSRDSAIPAGGWDEESIAAEYIKMLDEHGIEKTHWIVEGMGSPIGAAVAALYPDRVLSYQSTGPGRSAWTSPRGQRPLALGFPSPADAIEQLGMREWWVRARAGRAKAAGMEPDNQRVTQWILDDPVVGASLIPTEAAAAQVRWAMTWRWENLLPRVDCPIQFLLMKTPRPELGPNVEWHADDVERFFLGLAKSDNIRVQWLPPGTRLFGPNYTITDSIAPLARDFVDRHSLLDAAAAGHIGA